MHRLTASISSRIVVERGARAQRATAYVARCAALQIELLRGK
jgi:hypothetical protein